MNDVIRWLAALPPSAVYLVAGALVFAETGLIVGLILPGEVTLLLVGFLAAAGPIRLVPAVLVMMVAAFAGDALAFAEGRHLGPHVKTSALGRWVGVRRWDHATGLVRRYGGRAIFVGRFIAFARTLVPRLAALSGLAYRRVVGWDALGIAIQVSVSVTAGYLAGESYQTVADLLGKASGALVLLVVVIAAVVGFGRYLGRHPDPAAAAGARMGEWRAVRAVDRAYFQGFTWLTVRVGVGGAVAVNILLGVGVLLAVGVGLTWATNELVSTSGFPFLDPPVAVWMTHERTAAATHLAITIVSVLRGSYLVIVAGIVGLVLNRRPARWRADLLGVIGTVGAFLPLMILAFAVDWVGPPAASGPVPTGGLVPTDEGGLFANQVTLATASLGMLAWLVARRTLWAVRVAAWTAATGLVVLVSGARLYLGISRLSEIVTSILLGGLWVMIFSVAWRTRDLVRAKDDESSPAR